MIELLHMDCMEYMAGLNDNAFDLAIVDPPYGIGAGKFSGMEKVKRKNGTVGLMARNLFKRKEWDNKPPTNEYFIELKRVAKKRIIWGGNYFSLPPTRGIIAWDKKQPFNNFSAFELAWTDFDVPAKIFRYDNKGFMCEDGKSIHPTQKPIKLYKWLLANYAKDGDRILDTHLGSGSSAIAAHYGGFDFVGMELDKDYYEAACRRFDEETAQIAMVM